jgi:hypothetical protein
MLVIHYDAQSASLLCCFRLDRRRLQRPLIVFLHSVRKHSLPTTFLQGEGAVLASGYLISYRDLRRSLRAVSHDLRCSSWIAMTTCARSLPSHPGCLPAATTSTIRHVRVIRIPRARLQVRLRSPYTFALELCVQRVGCRQLCLGGSDQEGRSDRHQRVKHCVRVLICVTSQTDAGSVMAPASDPTRVPMRVRSPLGTRLCLNRVQMIRSWTSRWRRPLRAMVSRPLRILSLNSLYQDGTSST